MVINDATKLRLIRRVTGESLMLDLRKLRWDIIEAWLLSIEDKLKDAQVSSPGGDGSRFRREGKNKEMVHFSNFTSTEMAAEYTSAQHPRPLPKDHLILCLSFDLGVATQYAQDSNTFEMVWTIYYAMVHWGPFEFWFENVEYRLREARVLCAVNPPADLVSSSGPVEVSGLGDAPPVSSDEE
ncbi:hypothetical protein Cgig2_012335 [Carnegiea gigantea]|uniref:Uncharacterized protein n=1 Tax=Carnegiea gigantea TaxID=171969 RepID=A0A9Q1Q483_9CARY|nr:hypothetical protein Cgig2_012335 [Carnegiea gigantea]